MATYIWILLMTGLFYSVKANESLKSDHSAVHQGTNDLNSDASTFYSSSPGSYNNGEYRVTGHGILNNNYNKYDSYIKEHGYNRKYNNGPISRSGYTGGYEPYEGKPYIPIKVYTGFTGSKNGLEYNGLGNNFDHTSYSGNGGYGGYGGNGGLFSYLGYNNPYYHGGNHLGYGYYNKARYNSIYGSGITPSLVTGYRGYSRR